MFESVSLPADQRKSSLTAGGLVIPMVAGKPRLNKPPLIYWLQSASAAILTGNDPNHDAIWMYRLPSLIAALVIVLTTWRLGCSMFGPATGWLAGALLAVAPVFVWEAHQARADMVMIAWTTLAIQQLWLIWYASSIDNRCESATGDSQPGHDSADETRSTQDSTGETPVPLGINPTGETPVPLGINSTGETPVPLDMGVFWHAALLWVFVGLGILTKGPITLMIVGLCVMTLSILSRQWRWFMRTKPILGVLVVLLCVVPWVIAVSNRIGFVQYWSIVSDEIFGRAGHAREGHWGPPGYYLVLLVVLFWPGVLLTGLALSLAWQRAIYSLDQVRGSSPLRRLISRIVQLRMNHQPEAFLLAWLVPSWCVFELVSTKLPHYTMPLYPAVALLSARAVSRWPELPETTRSRAKPGSWLWYIVGLGLFGTVIGLLTSVPFSARTILSMVLLGLAMTGFIRLALYIRSGKMPRTQLLAIPTAACMLIAFLIGVAPTFFALTTRAHQAAIASIAHSTPPSTHALSSQSIPDTWVGFFEDSVVFLDRGTPSRTEPDKVLDWFALHPDGVAIVSDEAFAANLSRYREHGIIERTQVSGQHYTKGRQETLHILTLQSDAPHPTKDTSP